MLRSRTGCSQLSLACQILLLAILHVPTIDSFSRFEVNMMISQLRKVGNLMARARTKGQTGELLLPLALRTRTLFSKDSLRHGHASRLQEGFAYLPYVSPKMLNSHCCVCPVRGAVRTESYQHAYQQAKPPQSMGYAKEIRESSQGTNIRLNPIHLMGDSSFRKCPPSISLPHPSCLVVCLSRGGGGVFSAPMRISRVSLICAVRCYYLDCIAYRHLTYRHPPDFSD
ncbi:hypothetical protein V8C26DRAFT_118749 [Trichoderma gracile]